MARHGCARPLLLGGLVCAACRWRSTAAAAQPPDSGDLCSEGKPVFVLGAGISGLVAAHSLQHFGCKVVVFEAMDRVGGRTHTLGSEHGPFAGAEEGAHWVHGGVDNLPSSKLLSWLGVEQVRVGGDEVWEGTRDALTLYDKNSGRPLTDKERDASFDLFLSADAAVGDYVSDLCDNDEACNLTVAEAWTQALSGRKFTGEDELRLRWHQRVDYEQDAGAAIAQLNARAEYYDDYTSFYPDEGDAGWERRGDGFVRGGYVSVVDGLAKGLDVRLSSPVAAIEHSEEEVVLRMVDGRRHHGAAAVVTASVGALQEQLRTGALSFEPPLPAKKTAALGRLGMGPVTKLLVKLRNSTDERRLGPYVTGWVVKRDQVLTMCVRSDAEGRVKHVLECFAGGEASVRAQDYSKEELMQRVDHELSGILGPGQVEDVMTSGWNTNPYFMGAWSYVRPGGKSTDIDTWAAPVGQRLHFAGEGSCRMMYGCVHAAVVSGARAAHDILRGRLSEDSASTWPFFSKDLLKLCTERPSIAAGQPRRSRSGSKAWWMRFGGLPARPGPGATGTVVV